MSSTRGMRALLAVIEEALDVPLGEDIDAALRITRDRSIMVRHAARAALTYSNPADAAEALRAELDEEAGR